MMNIWEISIKLKLIISQKEEKCNSNLETMGIEEIGWIVLGILIMWWIQSNDIEIQMIEMENYSDIDLVLIEYIFQIANEMKSSGVYTIEPKDAFGHQAVPLVLLILSALRILTRDVTYDDIYEATFISVRKMRGFLLHFVLGILMMSSQLLLKCQQLRKQL